MGRGSENKCSTWMPWTGGRAQWGTGARRCQQSPQTISGAERPSRALNKVFALRPGSVAPSPLTTGWAELENMASAPCSGLALGPGLFLPESTPSLAPPLHVQRIPMGKVTTQESLHACPQSFLLTLLDTGVC